VLHRGAQHRGWPVGTDRQDRHRHRPHVHLPPRDGEPAGRRASLSTLSLDSHPAPRPLPHCHGRRVPRRWWSARCLRNAPTRCGGSRRRCGRCLWRSRSPSASPRSSPSSSTLWAVRGSAVDESPACSGPTPPPLPVFASTAAQGGAYRRWRSSCRASCSCSCGGSTSTRTLRKWHS